MAWVALGRDGAGVAAYAVAGAQVTQHVRGATDAEVLSGLTASTDRVLRVGDGLPDTAPCAVLPGNTRSLPVITQEQPADVLGAWVIHPRGHGRGECPSRARRVTRLVSISRFA